MRLQICWHRWYRPITRWPFFVFLCGAMFCLLASSTCHLVSCHSKRLSYIMLMLDYAGIASLISTSFHPPVYYSFMCSPFLCSLYLFLITLLGIATIVFSLFPVFDKPKFHWDGYIILSFISLYYIGTGKRQSSAFSCSGGGRCFYTLSGWLTVPQVARLRMLLRENTGNYLEVNVLKLYKSVKSYILLNIVLQFSLVYYSNCWRSGKMSRV